VVGESKFLAKNNILIAAAHRQKEIKHSSFDVKPRAVRESILPILGNFGEAILKNCVHRCGSTSGCTFCRYSIAQQLIRTTKKAGMTRPFIKTASASAVRMRTTAPSNIIQVSRSFLADLLQVSRS
jgi:hypothetical protein